MRSSKSRSRGNKNRSSRPTGGNVINRVFDSSGPDGKVRGTPQQIIEKYLQLHRDAQLAGDRVNAENFAQHAEHYTRILAEAQREVERVREEQEQFNRDRQAERDRERAQRQRQHEGATPDPAAMEQPDVAASSPLGAMVVDQGVDSEQDSGLIDLPEGKPAFLDARPRSERRPPRPERSAQGGDAPAKAEAAPVSEPAPEATPAAEPAAAPDAAAEPAAGEAAPTTSKPRSSSRSRKPRTPKAPAAAPEAAE